MRVYTSTELVVTGMTVIGKRPYYEWEQKRDGGMRANMSTHTNVLRSTRTSCSSQACLHTPSIRPSHGGPLRSVVHLTLCPGLQCLGLCHCGLLSHACKFKARPVVASVGKSTAFAAGGASPNAATIATKTTWAPCKCTMPMTAITTTATLAYIAPVVS